MSNEEHCGEKKVYYCRDSGLLEPAGPFHLLPSWQQMKRTDYVLQDRIDYKPTTKQYKYIVNLSCLCDYARAELQTFQSLNVHLTQLYQCVGKMGSNPVPPTI